MAHVVSALVSVLIAAVAVAARAALRATRGARARRRLSLGSEPDGAVGGLVDALPRPPAVVGRWLEQAGLGLGPTTAWWCWILGTSVAVLVALVAAAVGVAALVGVAATVGPAVVLRSQRAKGEVRFERALPAALEAVARSLRSGASLRHAVGEAAAVTPGPLGRELAEVARQVGHGATLVAALEGWAARRSTPGVRLTVAALCLGVETGGAQARAVDGVAATLRDRQAVAAEVRALSAQARVSALVIGLAPLGFGGFAVTTDPRTGDFLFRTPAGLVLLAVGLSLDALGWLWMQHLTRVPA